MPYQQLPVTPYNPPDPLAAQTKLGALQLQQQQLANEKTAGQSGQLDLQSKQLDLQSQQALMKAYQEAGGDLNRALPLAAKYGAKPQVLFDLRKAAFEQQKQNIELLNMKGAEALSDADLMQGAYEQLNAAPPEQRPTMWPVLMQQLGARGVDTSNAPQQYPGDAALPMMGIGLKGHKAQLEELAKKAGIEKDQAQTGQAQATTAKTQLETQNMQQFGGNPSMMESRYVSIQQRRAMGQPISLMDSAFMKAYEKQKTLVPQFNINMQNQTARGSNAALANVPPHLVAPATAAAEKAGGDYAQSKMVSDNIAQIMQAAKNGNVVSYQLLPQEGALQVTTTQGVHRINMAEIQNYGGGSLWQRLQGHIGKEVSGKSIPDSVLKDMADLQDVYRRGAESKYKNTLKSINQNYGASFQPVEMESSGIQVTDPRGAVHTFPDQKSADAFKQAAGIK